jgi:hypothetical protein
MDTLRKTVKKLKDSNSLPFALEFLGLPPKFCHIRHDSPDEKFFELFEELTKIGSVKLERTLAEAKVQYSAIWTVFVSQKDEARVLKIIDLIRDYEHRIPTPPSSPLFSKLN